jgi:tetratricopeptide (TPR) repeat protein
MDKIDPTNSSETRRLLSAHLKLVDKFLREGHIDQAVKELQEASALDAENTYVLAYRERISELRGYASVVSSVPGSKRKSEGSSKSKTMEENDLKNERVKPSETEEPQRPSLKTDVGTAADGAVATYLQNADRFIGEGKFEVARALIEEAFQVNPRDPGIPNMYIKLREARLVAQKQREQEETATQHNQQKVRISLERAREYLVRGKLEKALDEIGHASSIDAENEEVRQLAEEIQTAVEVRRKEREEEQRRREDDARRSQEEELRRRREEEERLKREEEQRRKAEEEARRQEQLRKIQGYLSKAQELLENKKFSRALQEIQQVYRLDANSLEAKQLEGTIRSTEEAKRKEAEEARRRAEEKERRRKIDRKVRSIIERARGYLRRGELERSLDEVANALSIDPENEGLKQLNGQILTAVEERRRQREEEDRRRAEVARRESEERQRRIREEEEHKRYAEEQRQKAAQNAKRLVRLQNIHRYLEQAVEELDAASVSEPQNVEMSLLDQSLRSALERVEEEASSLKGALPENTAATDPNIEAEQVAPTVQPAVKPRREVRRVHRRATPFKLWTRRKEILLGVSAMISVCLILLVTQQLGFLSKEPSLLILPFSVSPGSPEDASMGDALLVGFVSDFSRSGDIRVFNQGTSFALRPSKDLATSKPLAATYVVSGTLLREGNGRTLDLRLTDGQGEKTLWSGRFLITSEHVDDVRKSIHKGVMRAIGRRPVEALTRMSPPGGSPSVLDVYLNGLARLAAPTDEDKRLAYQSFHQALSRDPSFVLAVAGKATAALAIFGEDSKSDLRYLREARELSEVALSIDTSIASAHLTLGTAYSYNGNFRKALEEIHKALELEPSNAAAHRALALVYARQGTSEKASEAAERVLKLDPLNYESYVTMGLVHHYSGEYQEAANAYEKAVAMEPGVAWKLSELLENALLSQGSYRRALSLYENYLHLHPNDYIVLYKLGRANQIGGQLQTSQQFLKKVVEVAQQEIRRNPTSARAYLYTALALTRMGKFREAQAAARRAIDLDPTEPDIQYGMASMFSMQKQEQAALDWLGKAVSARYSYRGIFDVDLYNLRNSQDFSGILYRVE